MFIYSDVFFLEIIIYVFYKNFVRTENESVVKFFFIIFFLYELIVNAAKLFLRLINANNQCK